MAWQPLSTCAFILNFLIDASYRDKFHGRRRWVITTLGVNSLSVTRPLARGCRDYIICTFCKMSASLGNYVQGSTAAAPE